VKNISYQNKDIAAYFASNRVRWDQFYPSERKVIAAIAPTPQTRVLDIGCGCGGLGLALSEAFGVKDYTGVEINKAAALAGMQMNPHARILEGDILHVGASSIVDQQFDLVFSLSCVDWNVEFEPMFRTAWSKVAPGGSLVATFRLTDGEGCRDMGRSYQYINYEGRKEGELAAYVVLNAAELMSLFIGLEPARVHVYGYFGAPSSTAVTPYDRLCFVACSVHKRSESDEPEFVCSLDVPPEIWESIGKVTLACKEI
jgi:SAM-dependent methyltransferase